MAFSVAVAGGRDLTSVRRQLRLIGDQGLGRQMSAGLQRAAKDLKPAVQEKAVQLLPSGYGPLMSRSVRMRTQVRERRSAATLRIQLFGDGKTDHRDMARINKGVLRHPVYGRRRQPWVNQQVRRGFVDRPVDRLSPDIAREMRAIVAAVAEQITKG